ncbi:MAG: hypothetical protein A2161_09480 [Candidatus Schekmanbacteria bacterium RBG_13_48_7]|uniref:Uncharacterized protein n=1 Tax=Candidatus Schekmanbacteria bacterium RBG_13_48_7 TaxID=1817878 RepID=A0A1F7RIQ2_9BACT|nr:MAG: hypothetical protein A2161_09480 [Candidatus Schekmanbacteria bacterium RBG_13_48_7]
MCGTAEFTSNQYSYFETRTEFDIYTGRNRPVQVQHFATKYYLKTDFYLINVLEDTVVIEKAFEQEHELPRIADEDNIYVFYKLIDQGIKKFLEEIKPGAKKSRRFIL